MYSISRGVSADVHDRSTLRPAVAIYSLISSKEIRRNCTVRDIYPLVWTVSRGGITLCQSKYESLIIIK